jgi:hypothetical protein
MGCQYVLLLASLCSSSASRKFEVCPDTVRFTKIPTRSAFHVYVEGGKEPSMECNSMLSLQEVKQLVGADAIPDEEARALRDACYELGAIILEQWKSRRHGRRPRENSKRQSPRDF